MATWKATRCCAAHRATVSAQSVARAKRAANGVGFAGRCPAGQRQCDNRAWFREETGDETAVARTASAAQLADDIAVIMRGIAMALCGPPETVTAYQGASTVLTYSALHKLWRMVGGQRPVSS